MDRREIWLEVLLRRTPSLNAAAEPLDFSQPLPPYGTTRKLLLVSRPHLDTWKQYAVEAQNFGVFERLGSELVQLQFAISDRSLEEQASDDALSAIQQPPIPVWETIR